MKTCPTCNRTYDDDTLSFCLNDGTMLVDAPSDTTVTRRIPTPPDTDPNAKTIFSGTAWTPPEIPTQQPQYGAWSAPPPPQSSSRIWVIFAVIGALVLLVVGASVGLVLVRYYSSNESKVSSLGNDNDKDSTRNKSNPTATPTPTPRPTPTPTPEVPAAERLGLVGNWSGQQNDTASTLTIVSGEGNSFTGTRVTGEYQMSIVGTIDPATRKVTINETKVLKGQPYSNGKGWSLGKESGSLSADGRRLSGVGNDQYRPKTPYKWSYTKK